MDRQAGTNTALIYHDEPGDYDNCSFMCLFIFNRVDPSSKKTKKVQETDRSIADRKVDASFRNQATEIRNKYVETPERRKSLINTFV